MERNNRSESQDRRAAGKIPVVEERVSVDVQRQETGRLKVRKTVAEEDLVVAGSVAQDDVHVERIPVNRAVEVAPPAVRYEGDTMILSVVREEVVVQTRLVLAEEVRITRRQVERAVETPVTVRREEIIVERDSGNGDIGDSNEPTKRTQS